MPRPAGVATAAGLALDFADRIILESVRDIHDSVSGRVHGRVDLTLGHKTLPHHVHGAIATTVFTSIGRSLRGGGWALRTVDQVRPIGPALDRSPHGQFMVSALNGLVGAQIAERTPAMHFELALRKRGHDVPPTPGDLAIAYPDATDSVVVFIHGLCENENYWNRRPRPSVAEVEEERWSSAAVTKPRNYGDRLAADLGWTPLFIRANTGTPVRESGVALHALMTEVVENWPVEVRRIAFVGHSMGGLIVRAACDLDSSYDRWTALVTDVISLGTPHLGSPVERSIALGMRVATKVPELAPYRRIFMQRSAGVLDLSEGMPDPPRPLPRARYRLVAATLTRTTTHPLAIAIGDMLVQPRSAFGRPVGGDELFPGADTLHIANADHFDLLNHKDVYDAMRGWLAQPLS
ncbi:MAG: esterase/lipase family protein [Marmoricola sp.]